MDELKSCLPTRVSNCLLSVGINTKKDLLDAMDKNPDFINHIPNMGKASIKVIYDYIDADGFIDCHKFMIRNISKFRKYLIRKGWTPPKE